MEVSGLSGLASVYSLYNIMPTLDFPVSVKLSSTWRLLFFTAPDVDPSAQLRGVEASAFPNLVFRVEW